MSFRILGTRIEWLSETDLPRKGEALVIPANDHLWMLSGPGLDLKRAHGKDIEIEAVRKGPVEPGTVVLTSGDPCGYRHLFHAVVMGQDLTWICGAGQRAVRALLDRASREKVSSLVAYPLYRGVHGRKEEPAREMLQGFLDGLQTPSGIRSLAVLYLTSDEKMMLHETFLRLLKEVG